MPGKTLVFTACAAILMAACTGSAGTTGAQPASSAAGPPDKVTATETEAATPEATPGAQRQVTIWAPYAAFLEQQTLLENRDLIDEVNFFWYTLGAGGVIEGAVQSTQAVKAAREAGLRIVPSIVNRGFSRDAVLAAIGTPEARTAHIQAILDLVLANGFDGIDIDYESLFPEDRELFATFVEELSDALHAEGKLLSIAVHAKTDDGGSWNGPAAQDWARLGAAVDAFKIMTYDFHYGASEAGPIAPIDWIDEVLTYAATVVPPEKTFMGVHFYGYDWAGSSGESLEWGQVMKRVNQQDATLQRDASGEAWFTYDDGRRTVYFADAENVRTKLQQIYAKHPDLAGIAIWRLGGEDPANWAAIREWVEAAGR